LKKEPEEIENEVKQFRDEKEKEFQLHEVTQVANSNQVSKPKPKKDKGT
jgi:hypothetical protein